MTDLDDPMPPILSTEVYMLSNYYFSFFDLALFTPKFELLAKDLISPSDILKPGELLSRISLLLGDLNTLKAYGIPGGGLPSFCLYFELLLLRWLRISSYGIPCNFLWMSILNSLDRLTLVRVIFSVS